MCYEAFQFRNSQSMLPLWFDIFYVLHLLSVLTLFDSINQRLCTVNIFPMICMHKSDGIWNILTIKYTYTRLDSTKKEEKK